MLSGRGSNFIAIDDAIRAGRLPARIAGVVSDRPDAAGLARAAERGIDTVALDRARFPDRGAFDESLALALSSFGPRYVVLAGFMRVLGDAFVEQHIGRLINIHPSLLPRHRGLNTHQRVLEAGERRHGASVHFVTPALDAGPVLARVEMDVEIDDTPQTLADRLLPLEHRLYPAALALLLNHRVELRNDDIYIDEEFLSHPLVLGRDLAPDGRLLGAGDGR
jgi:phosphoribosylglycinamide formyltransferase-1